jgi:hypothetical protein
VHTNHCLKEPVRALEATSPSSSSRARLRRLRALLHDTGGALDVSSAQRMLADREQGDDAICREDIEGVSTNGAVIMAPGRGLVRACAGSPRASAWIDLKLPT